MHLEVIHKIIDFATEMGFFVLNLEYSPIKGPEGNIEYLVHLQKAPANKDEEAVDVEAVVEAAHSSL